MWVRFARRSPLVVFHTPRLRAATPLAQAHQRQKITSTNPRWLSQAEYHQSFSEKLEHDRMAICVLVKDCRTEHLLIIRCFSRVGRDHQRECWTNAS